MSKTKTNDGMVIIKIMPDRRWSTHIMMQPVSSDKQQQLFNRKVLLEFFGLTAEEKNMQKTKSVDYSTFGNGQTRQIIFSI